MSQCEPCEKLQELIDAHTVAGAKVDVDAQAERIAAGYKNPPSIVTGGAAYYRPAKDEVTMPPRDAFISTSAYYATLFHELAHSTGHTSRLNRAGITDKAAAFGSDVYSEEECVAELAAAFLCGEAGIEIDIERHASYVDGWSKKLREDPSMLPRAAAAAEKAANHILGK